MAKNPYIKVTSENQFALSERARQYRMVNKLDGAELLREALIPIGFSYHPPLNGLGNAWIIDPKRVYAKSCPKCHGTGIYVWGSRMQYSGPCFCCAGKGTLVGSDVVRNERYFSIQEERELWGSARTTSLECSASRITTHAHPLGSST